MEGIPLLVAVGDWAAVWKSFRFILEGSGANIFIDFLQRW